MSGIHRDFQLMTYKSGNKIKAYGIPVINTVILP